MIKALLYIVKLIRNSANKNKIIFLKKKDYKEIALIIKFQVLKKKLKLSQGQNRMLKNIWFVIVKLF